jgi:hypothetical protein
MLAPRIDAVMAELAALTPFGFQNRAAAAISDIVHQHLKGGDPVSHCLPPRSSESVIWILASTEVPVD